MGNQQSDQQMATMAGGGQLNLSGPSQLGGENTQNINSPDNSTNNVVNYFNCTFVHNNDNYTQMTHSFQVEGDQQPPRLSDNPPSGRLTEQCLQHMHNHIQAQSSWTGSRCLFYGLPILPDQSRPTPSQLVATESSQTPVPTPSPCPPGQSQMIQINDGIVRSRLASSQPVSSRPCSTYSRQDIHPQAGQKRENNQPAIKKQQVRSKTKQRTDEQSKSLLPRYSESTQTNAAPVIETEDIQATPTEAPDNVTIPVQNGRELNPGDGVWVQPDRSTAYYGIYLGGLELIRCDPNTQEMKMEAMDTSKNRFDRWQLHSRSSCRIFPAETRLERARSRVGNVPPVRESFYGLDFVYWAYTGLDRVQVGDETAGTETCGPEGGNRSVIPSVF